MAFSCLQLTDLVSEFTPTSPSSSSQGPLKVAIVQIRNMAPKLLRHHHLPHISNTSKLQTFSSREAMEECTMLLM